MDLKELHKQLLDLMQCFDAICTENDIHYTLHGGTLLGAIREQGFIPWDDDIDTAMTRADFNKLQKVLAGNKDYYIYGKIKKQFRRRNDNSLWIDIFIIDYIAQGPKRTLKLAALTMLDIMNRDRNSVKLSNVSGYSAAKRAVFFAAYAVGRAIPGRAKARLYSDLSEKRCQGDRRMMHRSNDSYKGRREDFPAEWVDEYIRVPFEGVPLSVLKRYHEILVKCYGEDYMTPVKDSRKTDVHGLVRGEGEISL